MEGAMDLKNCTAKDVMRKKVVSVRPELLVIELASIFENEDISGAPVIDSTGKLIGVVSKSDLVHYQLQKGPERDQYAYYRTGVADPLPRGFHVETPDRTRVRDIMTPTIIDAQEDAPVGELARLMRTKHIHRVLITKEDRVRGVVTTMDLVRVLEGRCGGSGTKLKPRSRTKNA